MTTAAERKAARDAEEQAAAAADADGQAGDPNPDETPDDHPADDVEAAPPAGKQYLLHVNTHGGKAGEVMPLPDNEEVRALAAKKWITEYPSTSTE